MITNICYICDSLDLYQRVLKSDGDKAWLCKSCVDRAIDDYITRSDADDLEDEDD